jgi:glycosyltransferase involved in cell wall biosynthesis
VEKVGKVYQLIHNQSASSLLEVIRFLENKKIDLINLHVSDTAKRMHLQYFGMMAQAKNLGIPITLTIHDVFPVESLYIDPSAVELLYLLGDSYIVGSDAEKDKLELYFNKNEKDIVSVKHGPYTMFNRHRYSKQKAKKELNLVGRKVILFFGQIRPNKGLKYLIKALPIILKEDKDVVLYISTDLHLSTPELNEYLNRIEKIGVAQHIRLVKEYVPSLEIEKIFMAADVVALPYTQISQSGVLNLAFAFKKPVVVSDAFTEAGCINGKMGYSFRSENYLGLAANISKILAMEDLGKAMGVAGYTYASTQANWKKGAELTSKAYQIALSKVKKN